MKTVCKICNDLYFEENEVVKGNKFFAKEKNRFKGRAFNKNLIDFDRVVSYIISGENGICHCGGQGKYVYDPYMLNFDVYDLVCLCEDCYHKLDRKIK